MKHFLIFILALFTCGCSSKENTSKAISNSNPYGIKALNTGTLKSSQKGKLLSRTKIKGISYSVRALAALAFLENKGERVEEEDKPFLEKETVVMLQIESNETNKHFFESSLSTFSKEDGMQYLVGEITQDISVFQGDNEFHPTGVLFERESGMDHKITVLFFFGDVDINKNFKIKYFDRMMNAGIINFEITN